MRKKIALFLVLTVLTVMCGCSKETKMGFGEFSDRINNDFDLTLEESSISLEKENEKNKIYCKLDSYLLVFYLGNNNNISGFAGMLPKENEDELPEFLEAFGKCVSVFTLSPLHDVKSLFKECKITADNIKFTDGNQQNTVGKFRYSVVMSDISVTVFCERA